MIILSEVNQKEKDKYHNIAYEESKIWHKWTYLENRNRLTGIENWLVVARRERGGRGMDWEFGISRGKLSYTEWTNNEVLLYSTGNYIQYPVINHCQLKKNAQPRSWELCFSWWIFWGLQAQETGLSDNSKGLLQRGKRGARIYRSFGSKDQVVGTSKDYC